jgi:hypothetical protein
MPAAISIQLTPQGVRSVVVQQELIFFIGPSSANRLTNATEFHGREDELKPLMAENGQAQGAIHRLFEAAYGVPIKRLKMHLTSGGKRGLICPNLHVDLVESLTEDNRCLVSICHPHKDVQVCRSLIQWLDADWVDLWWLGSLGNAQLDCERNGSALCIKRNGEEEVLS